MEQILIGSLTLGVLHNLIPGQWIPRLYFLEQNERLVTGTEPVAFGVFNYVLEI